MSAVHRHWLVSSCFSSIPGACIDNVINEQFVYQLIKQSGTGGVSKLTAQFLGCKVGVARLKGGLLLWFTRVPARGQACRYGLDGVSVCMTHSRYSLRA